MRATTKRLALLTLALGGGACGNLDNVTDVHDLRVLAVQSEPAGFLVPLDNPSSIASTQATVTALVVDPKSPSQVLTITGEACPDYIDTITAASGQSSKLCPSAAVTSQLPAPLDTALATTELPTTTEPASADPPIEYDPQVTYDIGADKLGLFFAQSPPAGVPAQVAQAIQYNRDFGFDAIVNLNFTLGSESASTLKRVVYWPLLPAALLPDAASNPECPATQTPNTNPNLTSVDLFRQRTDGIPSDPWPDGAPTFSLAAGDKIFAQPGFDPASIEHYFLRVKNTATGAVETQCRHELLTFQFFATSGTFSPPERTSELSPLLTAPANGHIPIDSQYNPPKASDVIAFGNVTIWIVARDERAGAAWTSRTFVLQP